MYYDLRRGRDYREVVTRRIRKSLGYEHTFERALRDTCVMADFMNAAASKVRSSLKERELAARRVTVKVKYADFRQVTRSLLLKNPLQSPEQLRGAALTLLGRTEAQSRRYGS